VGWGVGVWGERWVCGEGGYVNWGVGVCVCGLWVIPAYATDDDTAKILLLEMACVPL